MKKFILILVIISIFVIPNIVSAGLLLTSQSVRLKAVERRTMCDVYIFSTLDRVSSFHVNFPNLGKFVEKIEPNGFTLESINCPSEEKARIKCRDEECAKPNSTSCRQVCVTFVGPTEIWPCFTEMFSESKSIPGCGFSFSPKKTTIEGGVSNLVKVGSAHISEGEKFYIHYTPYDLMPPTKKILIVIVIAVIIYAIYRWKKPVKIVKYMYCKKCKKRYKKAKFCPECGEKLVEREEMEISLK